MICAILPASRDSAATCKSIRQTARSLAELTHLLEAELRLQSHQSFSFLLSLSSHRAGLFCLRRASVIIQFRGQCSDDAAPARRPHQDQEFYPRSPSLRHFSCLDPDHCCLYCKRVNRWPDKLVLYAGQRSTTPHIPQQQLTALCSAGSRSPSSSTSS